MGEKNSYAVKFQSFSEPQPQVKVYRVKGSLKNAKKIGGLRGLYLHYCYKLGILPKGRKQNYARLHYLLKDDLMKMQRFRVSAAGNGADERKRWEARKGRGGKTWSCVDSMATYLVIVLIGENASRRFSGATFQSKVGGLQSKPSVGRL